MRLRRGPSQPLQADCTLLHPSFAALPYARCIKQAGSLLRYSNALSSDRLPPAIGSKACYVWTLLSTFTHKPSQLLEHLVWPTIQSIVSWPASRVPGLASHSVDSQLASLSLHPTMTARTSGARSTSTGSVTNYDVRTSGGSSSGDG